MKIIESIDNIEQSVKEKIKKLKFKINEMVDVCFNSSFNLIKLGSVSKIFNGGTPNTNVADYWGNEINWATLVDTKNKYVYDTQRKISKKGLSSCNATLLPINTVLFSSRATIGDVSIAKIELCTNQGYKNFVCNPDALFYEYLYYILRHEAKSIESLASGMTYPEISKSMIADFKIPLPPIDKQKEIVSQVESVEIEIQRLESEIADFDDKKKQVLIKCLQ